jgi:hypothetical protein
VAALKSPGKDFLPTNYEPMKTYSPVIRRGVQRRSSRRRPGNGIETQAPAASARVALELVLMVAPAYGIEAFWRYRGFSQLFDDKMRE